MACFHSINMHLCILSGPQSSYTCISNKNGIRVEYIELLVAVLHADNIHVLICIDNLTPDISLKFRTKTYMTDKRTFLKDSIEPNFNGCIGSAKDSTSIAYSNNKHKI